MAFTVLQKYTTITTSEINDNFYHIACGSWLPRGGTLLDTTNGVYDLGSDNYRWENAYINNVNTSNITLESISDSIVLIGSHEINGANTATSRISFSINGDAYDFLEISVFTPAQGSKNYLSFNGYSNLSCSYYEISFVDTTIIHSNNSSYAPVISASSTTNTANIYSVVNCNTKTGGYRNMKSATMMTSDSDVVSYSQIAICYFTNTSSTITTLVFTGSFNTGASIKIWGNT